MTIKELTRQPAFSGNCVFAGVLEEHHAKKIIVSRGPNRLTKNNTVFMVVGPKSLEKIENYLESLS